MTMDSTTIKHLLENSGFEQVRIESDFIYFLDPSCIFPAFDTVLDYAWLAIIVLTAAMLFGWGVLYIKNGAKINTVFHNAKVLLMVLCTLGIAKPIVTLIYGENLFANQCEIKKVSRAEVDKLLEMRNKKFGKSDEYLLHESFNVVDTGALYSEEEDQ